jgi:hypothetical protein
MPVVIGWLPCPRGSSGSEHKTDQSESMVVLATQRQKIKIKLTQGRIELTASSHQVPLGITLNH